MRLELKVKKIILILGFIILLLTFWVGEKVYHQKQTNDQRRKNAKLEIKMLMERVDVMVANNKRLHDEHGILMELLDSREHKAKRPNKELVKSGLKFESMKAIDENNHKISSKRNKLILNKVEATEEIEKSIVTCDDLTSDSRMILSYTLFGKRAEKNGRFVIDVSREALTLDPYKDFLIRVYVDKQFSTKSRLDILANTTNVKFCDVRFIPKYGDVSGTIGTVWRFLPMGDSTIDVFCSRDLDSPLIKREADAVKEWLSTEKMLHVMRDRSPHSLPIMGGMWCLRVSQDQKFSRETLGKIIKYGKKSSSTREDQTIINNLLWPPLRGNVLQHDSYHCSIYKDAKPFPSERSDYFVGCVRDCWVFKNETCPVECRPPNHINWVYC